MNKQKMVFFHGLQLRYSMYTECFLIKCLSHSMIPRDYSENAFPEFAYRKPVKTVMETDVKREYI